MQFATKNFDEPVYYTMRAGEVVILLAGGDKSSQSADIAKAKELAKNL